MSELRFEAAGVVGTGMLAALFATTRAERVGAEHYRRYRRAGQPVIFVFWHGQLLPLVWYHRQEGIVVLVSEHADGEYITRVIERHGFGTVRGSSTRGATKALKGLIRAAREGHDLALTPDGPRGPAHTFKPGALAVAQATGLPVVPVSVSASSGWRFRSWDRFLVPRPLARIRIEYAAPVTVPRDADRAGVDAIGAEVEATLRSMARRASPGESAHASGGAAEEGEDRTEGGGGGGAADRDAGADGDRGGGP